MSQLASQYAGEHVVVPFCCRNQYCCGCWLHSSGVSSLKGKLPGILESPKCAGSSPLRASAGSSSVVTREERGRKGSSHDIAHLSTVRWKLGCAVTRLRPILFQGGTGLVV